MKDYEILSRATAFLLQVDPPDPIENDEQSKQHPSSGTTKSHNDKGYVKKSAFPHLKENIDLRKELLRKQDYKYDPAGGPARLPHQLNWLEFCPHNFRPRVHVVASSHVLSPWLWPKYYGQDWLQILTQEHVRYSLEVWGQPSGKGGKVASSDEEEMKIGHDGKLKGTHQPLAKFALNPYPIHHPKDMDVGVIHLKEEDAALEHLKKMGVQALHIPMMHELEKSNDPVFLPGERVLFQGFEVYEANTTDQETLASDESKKSDTEDDERSFHPYSSLGTLTMASPDRFLAQTKAGPLPEGLCGGPVIQLPNKTTADGNNNSKDTGLLTIRGVVEGIVPTNHENKQLAGMASFLPAYRVREFVDFAERVMLEQIIDKDLFKKVVDMKEKKEQKGTTYANRNGNELHELNTNENGDSPRKPSSSEEDDDDDDDELKLADEPNLRAGFEGMAREESDTPQIDSDYQEIVASLRENHSAEEVDAILATVEREREEVIKIMDKEGGDMDDVIKAVRRKTYEEKDRILKEIEKEMMGQTNIAEAEIVSSDDDKKA